MKTPELNLETDKDFCTQKTIITYDSDSNIDYQSLEAGTIVKYHLSNDLDILLESHPNAWTPSSLFSLTMCELVAADDCRGKVVMDFAGGLGMFGIVAGKGGAAQVIGTELNPYAVTLQGSNWALNGLNPKDFQSFESNCFAAIQGNREIEGKVDRIYLNPPALPDTEEKLQARLKFADQFRGEEWNRNGDRGRLVMDTLITQGSSYLAPGGEILFIATSKNGPRLTHRLMEKYWGKGIESDSDNPLDYSINWEERGDANWAVVHRINVALANYHTEFVQSYQKLADLEGEPSPFLEEEGNLYQQLYFIRAKKA
ncbi:MAG: methyltransferase [Moorea sp. SIO4E2]|uniref:methyltransferase n=2 Tax=unclassified Moorena TaxID=2683338 RepID=UPI0013BAF8C5|nr:methyltransferase [Moorena sp. SIO4E2]NEQ04499.1 methyltransferase [Moorena sp. SIO4E2]